MTPRDEDWSHFSWDRPIPPLDPRGRVNPTEPLILVVVAVLAVAGGASCQLAPCGVVWCGRREAGDQPGRPCRTRASSAATMLWTRGTETEGRCGSLGGAETRDGIVWAGSTHDSRPQHEPGQGPPRRACLAWVCRGGFWRAAGVLQARSSTQIIILRRAKGRSHVASEGAVALPPDRPFHIRILSKHHLF